MQPAAERTDEPARPRDGKVVEPAFADPPELLFDLPDVVVPALAKHLVDARQGARRILREAERRGFDRAPRRVVRGDANAIIALRCAVESNRFDDFRERRLSTKS